MTATRGTLRDEVAALAATLALTSEHVTSPWPKGSRIGVFRAMVEAAAAGDEISHIDLSNTSAASRLNAVRTVSAALTDLVLVGEESYPPTDSSVVNRLWGLRNTLAMIIGAVGTMESRTHTDEVARLLAVRAEAHVLLLLARAELGLVPTEVDVKEGRPEATDWPGPVIAVRDRWTEILERADEYPSLAAEGIDVVDEAARMHLDDEGRLIILDDARMMADAGAIEREVRRIETICAHTILPRGDVTTAVDLVREFDRAQPARRPPGRIDWSRGLSDRPERGTMSDRIARGGRRVASWLLPPSALGCLAVPTLVVLAMLAGGASLGDAACVASIAVAAAYGVMIDRVHRFGYRSVFGWCLRMPAAAFVGLTLVVTFGAGLTFEGAGSVRRWAAIALMTSIVVAVVGLEIRGHAPLRTPSASRLWHVAGLAVLHAMAVAVVGITILLPLAEESARVATVLTRTGREALETLLLTASTSGAVGLLLQTLWDDEPLASPVGRIEWH